MKYIFLFVPLKALLHSALNIFNLSVIFQAAMLDPRGARPVEHGTRDEKCATEKEWPFCTSDQWVQLLSQCVTFLLQKFTKTQIIAS